MSADTLLSINLLHFMVWKELWQGHSVNGLVVCVDYKIKMATSVGYMLTYYNDSRCMAKSHMHLKVLFMINVHKKSL